jgi:predicted RNA binding protein YcfA (HicA-like mRNA interferase family)
MAGRCPRPSCPSGQRTGGGLKPVSGRQMCRVLEARGWILVRVTGSHFIYRHPTSGRQLTVPVHANRDLKPGTQRSIMRDAELIDADL